MTRGADGGRGTSPARCLATLRGYTRTGRRSWSPAAASAASCSAKRSRRHRGSCSRSEWRSGRARRTARRRLRAPEPRAPQAAHPRAPRRASRDSRRGRRACARRRRSRRGAHGGRRCAARRGGAAESSWPPTRRPRRARGGGHHVDGGDRHQPPHVLVAERVLSDDRVDLAQLAGQEVPPAQAAVDRQAFVERQANSTNHGVEDDRADLRRKAGRRRAARVGVTAAAAPPRAAWRPGRRISRSSAPRPAAAAPSP
jgi:hypothetical protein